jgi:hypothetical protein
MAAIEAVVASFLFELTVNGGWCIIEKQHLK